MLIREAEGKADVTALAGLAPADADGDEVTLITAACALGCPRVALAMLRGGALPGVYTRCTAAFAGLEDVVAALFPVKVGWRLDSFYDHAGKLTHSTGLCHRAAVLQCERWRGIRRAWITQAL